MGIIVTNVVYIGLSGLLFSQLSLSLFRIYIRKHKVEEEVIRLICNGYIIKYNIFYVILISDTFDHNIEKFLIYCRRKDYRSSDTGIILLMIIILLGAPASYMLWDGLKDSNPLFLGIGLIWVITFILGVYFNYILLPALFIKIDRKSKN
ncbi:MAG TPA: hypothetical protein VHL11_09800 [Phototrophicaceae bacterium]|nr:hypothetical protein [Phototrophicaceae bacterium]